MPTALPRFRWGVALLAAAAVLFAFGLAALGVAFLNALLLMGSGETPWTRWLWLLTIVNLFLALAKRMAREASAFRRDRGSRLLI